MIEREPHPETLHESDGPHAEVGQGSEGLPLEEVICGDTVEPELSVGGRFLSLLFNTRDPVWKYILRAGLLSLLPSLLISSLVASVGLGNEETMPQFDREAGAVMLFIAVVIVSPVIETVVMAIGLWLLGFVIHRPLRQALVSSVVWAVLHSVVAPAWGLVVLWPFFVFSCAFLAWRQRSLWHGMGVACGVHMFQNLLPGILLVAI